MKTEILPNPNVALNNARNLPLNPIRENPCPSVAKKSGGVEAIENYINQRDKLWKELAVDQAKISAIAVNLLKDRNDFIEAIFRFKKIILQLFTPLQIEREKRRNKICAEFVVQLENEIKALMRTAGAMKLAERDSDDGSDECRCCGVNLSRSGHAPECEELPEAFNE
jgi:hypothetical protein